MADPDVVAHARAWLVDDPDPVTRAELESILDGRDLDALRDRFASTLRFGTAGLRGPMGAGPNRMNRVVVRRTTAGLVRHLGGRPTVVIGHDGRANSDIFALDAARVVAGGGGRALLLPPLAPTPLVAFAVRHLGADAGVVCTASHNPPADNGYKVYLGDGAQIVPPFDAEIAREITAVTTEPLSLAEADDHGIERLDDGIVAAYVDHARSIAAEGAGGGHTIVYSPLHGVGGPITQRVFAAAGFTDVRVVPAQARPHPDFPTVAFPNPEEPEALELTIAEARATRAQLGLVHDPDADRLGVVVPRGGRWEPLTGNQIGALLADHLLRRTEGSDRLVVDTVVSSRLLAAMAADHGVHHERTLTGFKWIVRPAVVHPEWRFVFGYEEALGFSVDPYVRDKDAITAGLVFAELVAILARTGRTVWDRLEELARRYGLHATETWSVRFDHDGERRRHDVMASLFDRPPARLAERRVIDVVDYRTGNGLPATDLVELVLEGNVRVAVRPSGTEPRIKVYAEVVVDVADGDAGLPRAEARARLVLDTLRASVVPLIGGSSTAPVG